MLYASDILTEIRRDLDETTASTSYWSDADLIAYMNRTLEDISKTLSVRIAILEVTGDGSSAELAIPDNERIVDFLGVLDGLIPIPKISYVRSRRESGAYSFLPYVFGDLGFSVAEYAGRQKIRIVPTVPSGETREVIAHALLGKIKASAYSTGTVTIVNGSTTVEGASSPAWTTGTNAVAGESIEINGHYYIIDSVTDADTLELTEPVREASAGTLSYKIGDATGLPNSMREMLVAGICAKAYRKDRDREAEAICRGDYDMMLREAMAEQDILQASNHYLGISG